MFWGFFMFVKILAWQCNYQCIALIIMRPVMALGLVVLKNVFSSCQKVHTLIDCFYCLVHHCAAMSLQAFSFPVSETRFLKAGSFIYNFNIIAGSSFRQDSPFLVYKGLGNVSQLFLLSFTPPSLKGKTYRTTFKIQEPAAKQAEIDLACAHFFFFTLSLSL